MRKLLYILVMLVAVVLLTGAGDPSRIWGPGAPPTTDDEDDAVDDVIVVEVDEDEEDKAISYLEDQRGVRRVEPVSGPYFRVYLDGSVDMVALRNLLMASYLFANVGFEYHAHVEVSGGCFGPMRNGGSSGDSSGEVWGPSDDHDDDDDDDDHDDDDDGEIWGPDRR